MSTRQRKCEAKVEAECHIHGTRIPESSYLPNYAKCVQQSEKLYAALLSTGSASEVRKLNQMYERNRSDIDASAEGMTALMDEIEESAKQGLRPYAAEQRLSEARERRALLRYDVAVKDFQGIEEHQYSAQAVKRMFAQTPVTVTDMPGGHVLLDDKLYSYNSPTEREEIIEARRAQASAEALSYRYTSTAVAKEIETLPRTRIVHNDSDHTAVVYGPRGAYMRLQFKPNGEIDQASTAHRSGDGSMLPVNGVVSIRQMLHAVDSGEISSRPLPSWVTGGGWGAPAQRKTAATSATTNQLF